MEVKSWTIKDAVKLRYQPLYDYNTSQDCRKIKFLQVLAAYLLIKCFGFFFAFLPWEDLCGGFLWPTTHMNEHHR